MAVQTAKVGAAITCQSEFAAAKPASMELFPLIPSFYYTGCSKLTSFFELSCNMKKGS
jgi:hypothetical protein